MQYKGYVASICYDDSADILHGRVINAADYPIATFEASDVEGLKREFKISIEDYLSACKEVGIEPAKPYSGKVNVNLGPSLHRKVTLVAMEDGMTANAWIKRAVRECLTPEHVWKIGRKD